MQLLERPPLRKRTSVLEHGTQGTLRATTLTALTQRHASGYSREFIRETVMSWAARKWPELLVGRDACGISFRAQSCLSSVQVSCAAGDGYAWAFRGTGPDGSGRTRETCVLVIGGQDHDLLTVRTSYTGHNAGTALCEQPKFLCSLIEHLPFEDGGHPIATQPRRVFSLAAFDNLRAHLLSGRRTLPILAVASEVKSEFEAPPSPSPTVLARALCGVAHVVSLEGAGISCLEDCLGSKMALSAGQARLFMPGLTADADPEKHPAFSGPRTQPCSGAGDVQAAAQRATHAWSTSTGRRAEFEMLWSRSSGA